MLWFYESFFPVVWIAFLLYWRIKAADTKTAQRSEPAASGILRALAFLIASSSSRYLASRCPGSTARNLAAWHLALLDWSCCYRWRPPLRRLGAPLPRRQLETAR